MGSILPPIHHLHVTPIMRHFEATELIVGKPIMDLACEMNTTLPDGPEKSAGLRKLLEAKDCFMRALK